MRVDLEQARVCLNRRQFLQVGGLGSLSLTLPGLLRAEAERTTESSSKHEWDNSANSLMHPDISLRRSQSH